MFPTVLQHLLGVCCALYTIQLLTKLGQDFKGNRLVSGLIGTVGGIVSIFLAVLFVLGVDYVYPVGSAATSATFFVRLSFLIPLSYLAAALSSLFINALLGRKGAANIVIHLTYLGITLIILAPTAHVWYTLIWQLLKEYI